MQSWLDTDYRAEFRMPRADVRAWLTGTYPDGPEPGSEFCAHGADLCLNLNSADAPVPDGAQAHAVTVNVVHEGPGTARIVFSAFTV